MRVFFAGHFTATTGFGHAAADAARALVRAGGCELGLIPILTGESRRPNERAMPLAPLFEPTGTPDVILLHELPWNMPDQAHRLRQLFPGVPIVGYTAWEATLPPLLEQRLRAADLAQLWVPSRANARAFRALAPNVMLSPLTHADATAASQEGCYLRVVPHAFDEERAAASLEAVRSASWAAPQWQSGPTPAGVPYRFYWVGGWNARKNPAGLIRAFVHEFDADEDDVELYLHSPGATKVEFAEALASAGLEPGDRMIGRITLGGHTMTDDGMVQTIANQDCYVTAARGEAWNLPAFEAMLLRRHVISPSMLGSDDFLLSTSAQLYSSVPQPAHSDYRAMSGPDGAISVGGSKPVGLTAKCVWREPDLLGLARCMRDAYQHRTRTLTLSADPARFGYTAVGLAMTHHLREAITP